MHESEITKFNPSHPLKRSDNPTAVIDVLRKPDNKIKIILLKKRKKIVLLPDFNSKNELL